MLAYLITDGKVYSLDLVDLKMSITIVINPEAASAIALCSFKQVLSKELPNEQK